MPTSADLLRPDLGRPRAAVIPSATAGCLAGRPEQQLSDVKQARDRGQPCGNGRPGPPRRWLSLGNHLGRWECDRAGTDGCHCRAPKNPADPQHGRPVAAGLRRPQRQLYGRLDAEAACEVPASLRGAPAPAAVRGLQSPRSVHG